MIIRKVLFVCSANLCRSPMAEAIFKKLVSDNHGPENIIEVQSAGTYPGIDGAPAMENAAIVMSEHGLDISSHRAQFVNDALVDWSDLILTMTAAHKQHIESNFANARGKVQLITECAGTPGDISDPVFSSIDAYRECATYLESLLGILKLTITE
jgi:protein-tyrosine-phosphatase